MRRRSLAPLALALATAVLVLGPLGAGAPDAAAKKLAMIMPGSIQDADYNAIGYVALQALRKAYDMDVAYSESVAVADAERVGREYVAAGYDIVAFHGGQFTTIAKKLSNQFPQTNFIHEASGPLPDAGPNLWVIGRKWYQGFYPLGAAAALATKTNKVGFIGGVRIPDVVSSINAVAQAVREHNPKAQFVWNLIGDFNDPVKARQTAEAQIGSGVDVIVPFINLGLYGLVEGVKASPKPVLLTTFQTPKWDLAPKHFMGSLLVDFVEPYKEVVSRIAKGERKGYYEMRPGRGMSLSEMRNVSPEVAAKVRKIFDEVVAGKPLPEVTDKLPSQ